MAASRRGQPELHVRMPSATVTTSPNTLPDLPPVSALFLIDFDVKAGYTISWKAAKPDIDLEGTVEYKSLPSGLHTVNEDLIYFVHGEYAGLSAFVNTPVEDTQVRNARMLAVGVLVPLSYGRLGRAWRHAENLKEMAAQLVLNTKDTTSLEEYWEKHQAREDDIQNAPASKASPAVDSPALLPQTPKKRGQARNRSPSGGAMLLAPGHRLSPYHPAWNLIKMVDTFGPLIFPIQRAALLRKRILISCHTPVQQACDFVYNISILSNIPLQTFELLSPDCPPNRLQPLFTIGVHDIPYLTEQAKGTSNGTGESQGPSDHGSGWIACTTDSILAMKDTLWDMLITLPAPHSANASKHVWPTVEYPHNVPVKATQRDLRRFRSLKSGLARIAAVETPRPVSSQGDSLPNETESIVEPLSWTALAYNGFMWWASAGEQGRSDEAEEISRDAGLLVDLSTTPSMEQPRRSSNELSTSMSSLTARGAVSGNGQAELDADEASEELATITYFHRLTTQYFTTLADIADDGNVEFDLDADEEGDTEEDDPMIASSDDGDFDRRGIRIGSQVLTDMGLDIWSASDAEFVKELVAEYFGRKVLVEGKGVEVCGVKVC